MSFDADRLYELLPAVYRIRDQAQGEPLKALVEVVAEQVSVLEENIEQLYDDQFIETCAPWVVPLSWRSYWISDYPRCSAESLQPPSGSS